MLEALDLPLLRVLGPEVAQVFADLHREHGVDLRTGVQVDGIAPAPAAPTVGLGDGARSTSTAWSSGSASSPTSSSPRRPGWPSTTASASTRGCAPPTPHVYAIGDVANADHPVLGLPLRVEHWDTAIKHGRRWPRR